MDESDASRMSASAWLRRESRPFLEFFALCGVAFAQPLLDLLSKNTGLFVFRRTSPIQLIVLVMLVTLVPPITFWTIEAGIGAIAPRSRRWVHGVLAGVLVGVIALEAVKHQSAMGPTALVYTGVVAAILGGVLVLFVGLVRQFLRYLAFAPVVFAVLFLAFSPVTGVVFASSSSAAAANVGIAEAHRVVVVAFDELPLQSLLDGEGHIDGELYPSFARFAADSTWYRNTSAVAPYTDIALPSILTGRYPRRSAILPFAADHPRSLFSLLGKAYDMNVHESMTSLCSSSVCETEEGTGFGALISQSVSLWRSFAAPEREQFNFGTVESLAVSVRSTKQFIRSIHPATSPRLDFVHVTLPHSPWRWIGSLQDYELTEPAPGARYLIWSNETLATISRQRHLLQTQAADNLLGQIIEKLEAVGGYEDALVVVTADHGISFRSDEPLRHPSMGNYSDIMWVPLLVKYPGQVESRVDDRPAELVDVFPTIVEAIGAEVDWTFDGRSLRESASPERPRRIYQWTSNTIRPDDVLSPEPGKDYLEFDGKVGFERALSGTAAPPGGDPELRIFRWGPYGHLIGEPVGPMLSPDQIDSGLAAGIHYGDRFDNVDPAARSVPWVYSEGYFHGLEQPEDIAIAVNGTVAALSTALKLDDQGNGFFAFVLPPTLVRAGANAVEVYVIRGDPADPRLELVAEGS